MSMYLAVRCVQEVAYKSLHSYLLLPLCSVVAEEKTQREGEHSGRRPRDLHLYLSG